MRIIAPRTGAPEHTFGEDQHEYQTVTAAVYAYGNGVLGILFRARLTQEERQQLIDGADLYMAQIMPMGPQLQMVPFKLSVGLPDEFVVHPGMPEVVVQLPKSAEPPQAPGSKRGTCAGKIDDVHVAMGLVTALRLELDPGAGLFQRTWETAEALHSENLTDDERGFVEGYTMPMLGHIGLTFSVSGAITVTMKVSQTKAPSVMTMIAEGQPK